MNLLYFFISKQLFSQPGSQLDNGCVSDGGYSWCDSLSSCVRIWETPCPDNYDNCPDCFERQSNGENIACPSECDYLAVDPMPPVIIDPMPCPDVMCMMYCPFGHRVNEYGCQMCECNDKIPDPISDTDCTIQQPSCDGYTYLCPKITEITSCGTGGILGYTTYQLSVVLKDNMNIKNIFAIYGDADNFMYLPPAFNLDNNNQNIGGVSDSIKHLIPYIMYDSWLTIGLTNGDPDNKISSVGIDFKTWDSTNGLTIDNGAVFVTNPQDILSNSNEYIIAQLTVSSDVNAVINIQGKTIDNTYHESWIENNVVFNLVPPNMMENNDIPDNCIQWYDGCNTCRVSKGTLSGCTRMMCFREDKPRCISYSGH